MTARAPYSLVLAIYPNSRGIAFVVFEGERMLIDWGIRGAQYKHKNERHVSAVGDLFALYQPAVVILQNMDPGGARRAERIRGLNAEIAALATELRILVRSYSRTQVQNALGRQETVTKEAIVKVVAEAIPALRRHIPPPRKPWNSEHARMGLFDAAALALTFFWRNGG